MNKKEEVIELIRKIDSDKFIDWLYRLIMSFKKEWGYRYALGRI